MMKRELTCIVCPIGCQINVTEKDGKLEITGNSCPRGAEYAKNECTNPTRVVTSTMLTKNGLPRPVKTDRPIPKSKIFDCMKIINSSVLDDGAKIGDIAVKDVFGSNIVVSG